MVWGYVAASGPGQLSVIDKTMSSALYQKIQKKNVWSSICDLKLKRSSVIQQDNNLRYKINSTFNRLKKQTPNSKS